MANLSKTIEEIGKDIKLLQAKGVKTNGVKYAEYQRGTIKRSEMELVSGTGNSSNFKVKFAKPFSKVPTVRFSATSALRATVMYNVYEVTTEYFMFTQNYYGSEPTLEYEAFTDPEIVPIDQSGGGTGIQFEEIDYDPMFQEGYFAMVDKRKYLKHGDWYLPIEQYSVTPVKATDVWTRVLSAGASTTESFVVIWSAPFTDEELQNMLADGWVMQDINPTDYGTLSGQAESYKKFKLLVNTNDGVTETDIQQGNKNIYPLKPEYQMNINVQPKANFGYTLPTMYGRAVDFTSSHYALSINLTS